MKTQKTIAIIGGALWGNSGAEAMLVTTIGEIRKFLPEAKFIIYTPYPRKDRQLLIDTSIDVHSSRPTTLFLSHLPLALISSLLELVGLKLPLPTSIQGLRDADVLLDVGGITFADKRTVFLFYNVLTILPAMLLGTPVIKLSQALGPFKTFLNRTISKWILPRCAQIFARGRTTAEYLTDLGMDGSKWKLSTDIAFLYQNDYSLSNENQQRVDLLLNRIRSEKAKGKHVIALSPSILVDRSSEKAGIDYSGMLQAVVGKFSPEDTIFVFFPGASREGSTKQHNNDLLVIGKMKVRLAKDDNVCFVDFDINTRAIRNIVDEADILFSSRFHSMIAGLATCTPTYVLGWSHKYSEVLQEFKLEHHAIDFSQQVKVFETIPADNFSGLESVRNRINDSLTSTITLAREQFIYVREFLIENHPMDQV